VLRALHLRHLLPRGALLLTIAAVLAGCHHEDPASDGAQVRRGLAAIEGIPQDGFTLGRSDAPWTLTIISPATSYELDQMITQLPAVSEQFVRPGRLKLQLRTPAAGSSGGDGEQRAAASALLAAGLRGRYWDALVRLVPAYRGALSDAAVAALLRRSGVRDVASAMAQRSTYRIQHAVDRADAAADAAKLLLGRGYPAGPNRVVYLLTPAAGRPLEANGNITSEADQGRLAIALATSVDR
jgi:hypothetical protein